MFVLTALIGRPFNACHWIGMPGVSAHAVPAEARRPNAISCTHQEPRRLATRSWGLSGRKMPDGMAIRALLGKRSYRASLCDWAII